MRHPRIHKFLIWAGPSLLVFIGASAGLIITAAQKWEGIANWAESWFYRLVPVMTATWFLILGAVLILGYIGALIYTGGEKKAPEPPLGFYDNHHRPSNWIREQLGEAMERGRARDALIRAVIVAAEDRLDVVKGRIRYAQAAKRRGGEFLDDWLDKVRADTQGIRPGELEQLRAEAARLLTDQENKAHRASLTALEAVNDFAAWARDSKRSPERITGTFLGRMQKADGALVKLIAQLRQ